VDSVRYDMVAQCGAGGQPKLYFNMTHTRLWRWCYARRNFEPVDLPLLLSQTNYNWSLAPVEAHVDSATPNVALAAAHASLIGISFLYPLRTEHGDDLSSMLHSLCMG